MWIIFRLWLNLQSSYTRCVGCSFRVLTWRWPTYRAKTCSCIPTVLTYLLTYLLTPWCRVLLEKLTGQQLVKKFPAFHGTRRFITALTSVRHLSLSWASPIQSIYTHPTSRRSILILSAHLRLGLPSGLLPSGFPTKTLYTPLSSPIRATCPAHLILLDFITRTILGDSYCTTRWNIVVFDCKYNILNCLLLNQHNGDDAPQNYKIRSSVQRWKKALCIYITFQVRTQT